MFTPKIDNLYKHARRSKALVGVLGVCDVGEYYTNKDFVNAKNERLYAIARKDSTLKQVCHVAIGRRKKKLMQFSTYFHMLVEKGP
jgi:hypothetical protein